CCRRTSTSARTSARNPAANSCPSLRASSDRSNLLTIAFSFRASRALSPRDHYSSTALDLRANRPCVGGEPPPRTWDVRPWIVDVLAPLGVPTPFRILDKCRDDLELPPDASRRCIA